MRQTGDISRSIHLSASAGSGKTRSLVERFLKLIGSGRIELDQALAITFTEKAAAEMKQRVMHTLAEAAQKAAGGGSEAELMFRKIIRGRQDLRISTIHSFCMNILKRYPLEAGLPPDFGVLDARDRALKIQRAIADALEESDRDTGIIGPLGNFTAKELEIKLEFLLSQRNRIKRMEIDAGGFDGLLHAVNKGMGVEAVEPDLERLIKGADWGAALLRMHELLKTQGNYYEECLGREHLLLAEANNADGAFGISESLASVYFRQDGEPYKNPKIPRKHYTGKNRADYEDAYFKTQDIIGRLIALHNRLSSGRETMSLLRLYRMAEESYQASKLKEGLLDFDDLEIYAYALLKKPESLDILYWLDRKIIHFLIDEFQDTSDIQWAILEKLTEEIFAGAGADKPMQPTLFVVGDEKQSIYRFREANYQLLGAVRDKMERMLPPEARDIRTLTVNFRSVPELIRTVNQVFGKLWGDEYIPSETHMREYAGSVRLIEITPCCDVSAGSGPSPEAKALANEIKSVVENGTPVYEISGASWKTRPAAFDDCAVLIQSRTRLKEYEAALQAYNVPYRVIGGVGFYEEDEIQAVMNVLFFLWNRQDALSLAAALKSPLFGISDADIYELRRRNGDMLHRLKDLHAEVWRLLSGWMRESGLAPLPDLIHRIISDTGAYVRFGKLRGAQAIFNLDKLQDTAREFDRRGYATLQDFVEWVRNVSRSEEQEAAADVNLPEFEGSAVITTVHKAKGLEFPIVFLPGMNQATRSLTTKPEALIKGTGAGILMAVGNDDNPTYDELWDTEKVELRREHQRLLYVAMTRARDHLIMIGALEDRKNQIKQNTWLSYLHETMPQLLAGPVETDAGTKVYSHPADTKMMTCKPDVVAAAMVSSEASLKKLDAASLISNISPVLVKESLGWKKATDYIEAGEQDMLIGPAPQAGAAASSLIRGSVLHRCLEEFTKTGEYDPSEILREYAEIGAIDGDSKEGFMRDLESVIGSVFEKPDLAWIFERRQDSYSELPFVLRRGKSLISGIVDRVVIKGKKGFVIDYKAIRIESDDALASWREHYGPQIRIYCEAAKDIFGLEQVEGHLLFLDGARLELVMEV